MEVALQSTSDSGQSSMAVYKQLVDVEVTTEVIRAVQALSSLRRPMGKMCIDNYTSTVLTLARRLNVTTPAI